MIIQLFTNFIVSGAFAVIFNVPEKNIVQCCIVGMAGRLLHSALMNHDYDTVQATLIASFSIGVISQIFAKFYKTPVIVFSISGILPLVPGGLAFEATRHFVEDHYNLGIQNAVKAIMTAGSIAVGLVLSEAFMQILKIRKKFRSHGFGE
ncbi:threonine/serine exporter family protein [Neobacillus sp. YIM B06451]|uniref:threonine/serine exporter family protein n=1 Tax=Neobacillus sp. YIM B06451 TaxID=3070994 RepID=UPI00292F4C71|nr:threonine/serine exporter family protein [Neobacillus sp. YIM B06451]